MTFTAASIFPVSNCVGVREFVPNMAEFFFRQFFVSFKNSPKGRFWLFPSFFTDYLVIRQSLSGPLDDCVRLQAAYVPKLHGNVILTVNGKDNHIFLIPSLLSVSSPSAIFGGISFIGVDAIKRCPRWFGRHVIFKITEDMPSFAYRYPLGSIPRPSSMIRTVAAGFHALPSGVKRVFRFIYSHDNLAYNTQPIQQQQGI